MARWIDENHRPKSWQFKCSECGEIAYYPQSNHEKYPSGKLCGYKYCPNCGVKMADRKTEPQYDIDKGTIKCDNCSESGSYKCSKCDGEMYFKRLEIEDEPQTERSE